MAVGPSYEQRPENRDPFNCFFFFVNYRDVRPSNKIDSFIVPTFSRSGETRVDKTEIERPYLPPFVFTSETSYQVSDGPRPAVLFGRVCVFN